MSLIILSGTWSVLLLLTKSDCPLPVLPPAPAIGVNALVTLALLTFGVRPILKSSVLPIVLRLEESIPAPEPMPN